MKRILGIILLILMIGILTRPVYAESRAAAEKPWEKFSLNLGAFLSTIDSSIRIGVNGIGVDIDFEDLLDLDSDQSVFRADAVWRFSDNRRRRFDFTWFSCNRSSTKKVGDNFDVELPDGSVITITAGSNVNTSFDLDIYKVAYSYSFFQDDRIDLGLGLGLYVMPIGAGLKVTGLVDESEAASFTAPLPVVGLRADMALTPKSFIRLGTELFYLRYDNFTGTLLNTFTRLEYNPWKHVGFGLGVESFRLSIESDGEDYPNIDFKGNLGFAYTGLELYARIIF